MTIGELFCQELLKHLGRKKEVPDEELQLCLLCRRKTKYCLNGKAMRLDVIFITLSLFVS